MRSVMAYKMTIPKTLLIPILLRYGTADSTKEAITIEVRTTRTKSLKNHNKNTPSRTKIARIIVLVGIEMEISLSLSNIKI